MGEIMIEPRTQRETLRNVGNPVFDRFSMVQNVKSPKCRGHLGENILKYHDESMNPMEIGGKWDSVWVAISNPFICGAPKR